MKVTILTCTPDIRSQVFKNHAKALKEYTSDYEWIVVDNNYTRNFNHARELNRTISGSPNGLFVTLDDDLIVKKYWLEGLLNASSCAEVIGGVHRYNIGTINHSGGYILSDGTAGHFTREISNTMYTQYVCSAVMMINRDFVKRNTIVFDENYSKFFLETDYCLQVWEVGGRVMVTPKCDVVHLVSKVVSKMANRASLYSTDSSYFANKWITTGRLQECMRRIQKFLNKDYAQNLGKLDKLLTNYMKIRELASTVTSLPPAGKQVHSVKQKTNNHPRPYKHENSNITSLRTIHKISEQFQDFDEGKRIYKETLSLIP
ncbi:hypothetical protein A2773_03590 [Candidatus Gottesmanbacteria bacterium RIFCSPHIGHO2_01_FULL_39_10]|uniref:Glycosyltransferase 2-like domain-containing protein n=1 Tax=Candidatus Gottesmanbacteria bacterium RIFCSPHIGHO2_01_FULL_39_10 TaxID=1798375 RepID=A0A1F5ZSN2_9BACT|nr:MAG: hypothetical protein A2773_03590 [Candidatus Gottesmanbacteria bacterium RIFCSPHIGHO2_01_FULL_39_10]